jgi:hypothetical protein
MTEREQAVEALHRSVRDRISVPLQAYAEALAHWRVVPIRDIDGTIVGAVALDGNEIHVGAYRRPASCQRGLLRRELRETINRYGYARTHVRADNAAGLSFCRRLGFTVTEETEGVIEMRCERTNYA